jgi:predicted transcriptional regulator
MGMSFNSIRYHVRKLTLAGEILRIDEPGYSRLYPKGTNDGDRVLLATVRKHSTSKILSSMLVADRVSQKQLSQVTGLAKSTVSETMANLVELGVARQRPVGGQKIEYELLDPARIGRLLNLEGPTLLRKATDRFIDLWDF